MCPLSSKEGKLENSNHDYKWREILLKESLAPSPFPIK
jgi:hypothetical protein